MAAAGDEGNPVASSEVGRKLWRLGGSWRDWTFFGTLFSRKCKVHKKVLQVGLALGGDRGFRAKKETRSWVVWP